MTALGRGGRDALELTVAVPEDGDVRALAYPSLVGVPQVGDDVLLNTTALGAEPRHRRLRAGRRRPRPAAADPTGPGHLVKARYTPLQVTVQGVDEQDTEHHATARRGRLARRHAGGRRRPALGAAGGADRGAGHRPGPEGRLRDDRRRRAAAGFSRTLDALRESLAGVVTVGQAFGGDLEAVTVHTGLLAARHVLDADLAIVTQGPGNLGTGTPWGFSGVAAGEACNAVTVLGGAPSGRCGSPRPTRGRGTAGCRTTR